ncbi:MAG TPA: thermosome subunit [Candidatus Poseidoniales archaeon]|jgi:chaperonin GroEL (HSP60 family)|nr:MAG: thermosome subunit [Euryarchaeota archaeon]HIG02949.1 thermosome subunit [Candidatus Poseidoniales archaeon]HIK78820.1 thermosome subunit [Candidatus Poseidoniales archaeon]
MSSGDASSEFLKNTERSTGSAALRKNIQAALALAGTVRSTLGPRGLDKMLVDEEGRSLVTNDGVTVLQTADIKHPAAKLIISASSLQDSVARDGTTTTVLICAELLENAWELIRQGIHPTIIAEGYWQSLQASLDALQEISRPIDMSDNVELLQATKTSLAGKGFVAIQSRLAELAVEAANLVTVEDSNGVSRSDPTLVKVLANRGGSSLESNIISGLVLAKSCIHPKMKDFLEGGKILLLDGELEMRSPTIDATLKITDVGMLNAFKVQEKELLKAQVDAISQLNPAILVVKEGVRDEARQWLADAGITTYRRVEKTDLELLSRATGARIINRPESASESDLGGFSSSHEELWGSVTHWILEGEGQRGATLVTRGATEEILEEVERCFADAIGVACQLLEQPLLLPGGGATQVAIGRRLRRLAESIPGREQLAMEAYADALEVIPRVLAENSGLDPIDELLRVVSAQTKSGDWIGMDSDRQVIVNMDEAAIREPILITQQALKGATESAINILRIDDVLWAKEGPSIPGGMPGAL